MKYKRHKLILFVLGSILVQSCGIITPTRYGNGLHFESELNIFGKNKQTVDTTLMHSIKEKRRLKNLLLSQTTANQVNDIEKNTAENDSIIQLIDHQIEENTSITLPDHQAIKKNKLLKEGLTQFAASDTTEPNKPKTRGEIPMEENAMFGGYLFYGGLGFYLILGILASFSGIILGFGLIGFFLPIILFAAFIAGFVLAIVALGKIKKAAAKGIELRGKGLAISVIVVASIFVIIPMLAAIVILAILFASL